MPARPATLLALLALLPPGCGVDEYTKRMEQAQERLKRYEEESKLLEANPINFPPQAADKKGPAVTPVEFHLRLPLGLSTTPPAEPRLGLFYDYIPAKPGAVAFASVAFGAADDAKFPDLILSRVAATGPQTRSTFTARTGPSFTRVEFDADPYSYSVNFHKGSSRQIAVVYAAPKGQRPTRAIDVSLHTFGVEGSLNAARQASRPGGPLESVPRGP